MISKVKTCSNIFEPLEQLAEHWNKFSYARFYLGQPRLEAWAKSLLWLAFLTSWFMYTQFYLVQRGLRQGDWYRKAFL